MSKTIKEFVTNPNNKNIEILIIVDNQISKKFLCSNINSIPEYILNKEIYAIFPINYNYAEIYC